MDKYYASFFPSATLRSLFFIEPALFRQRSALITYLDSDRDVAAKFKGAFPGQWRAIGQAAYLESDLLEPFFSGDLSNSFDEVYLYESGTFDSSKVKRIQSVLPDRAAFNNRSAVREASAQLSAMGAVVLLADGIGIGLNVLCAKKEDYDRIVSSLSP